MINLFDKLNKLSEEVYGGQIRFDEIKELMDNNMFILNKNRIDSKPIIRNNKIVDVFTIDKKTVEEITYLISNDLYAGIVKLYSEDGAKYEVLEGFHALLAVQKEADKNPNKLLSINVIKSR